MRQQRKMFLLHKVILLTGCLHISRNKQNRCTTRSASGQSEARGRVFKDGFRWPCPSLRDYTGPFFWWLLCSSNTSQSSKAHLGCSGTGGLHQTCSNFVMLTCQYGPKSPFQHIVESMLWGIKACGQKGGPVLYQGGVPDKVANEYGSTKYLSYWYVQWGSPSKVELQTFCKEKQTIIWSLNPCCQYCFGGDGPMAAIRPGGGLICAP